MSFKIVLSGSTAKVLAKMDRSTMQRISNRLDQIAIDPFGERFSKPLASPKGFRASRVGDWRVIFTTDVPAGLVRIRSIGSRGQIYRGL